MTRDSITTREVVLHVPGTADVRVRRAVRYGGDSRPALLMDLYVPATPSDSRPVVVLVTGYADAGAPCSFRDWAAYVGWARLVACRGMAAIVYQSETPARDARTLIGHVHEHAAALGIDASRIGVWACSGNTANALALLRDDGRIACAALCYGYLADAPGFDDVARAAERFGFVAPAAGTDLDGLRHVELLVVRAGRDDMPGLNASLDRFVVRALAANLNLTVINHADGPHAFDIFDAGARSCTAIRSVLGFLESTLAQ